MDKATIQDIAIKVLITNNGASMQDIAAAAGIGRTTLHRYFANRDELMQALVLLALEDAEQAVLACQLEQGTVLEAIERVVKAFVPLGHRFHFLLSQYQFYGSAESNTEINARENHLIELFDELMRRGQREGVLRPELPVRWLNDTLTALLFTAWENIQNGYVAPRDAPRLVMTTFLNGAATSSA